MHGGPEATSGTPYDGSGLAALHAPLTHPVRRYAGTRVRDGARLLVPAGLVDYPAESEGPAFDPGPSGTASGIGHERALRSALLETIERDAVIVSWTRRRRTRAVDVDGLLAGGAPDASWRRVADLLALVRRGGMEPVLAESAAVGARAGLRGGRGAGGDTHRPGALRRRQGLRRPGPCRRGRPGGEPAGCTAACSRSAPPRPSRRPPS
ncbi:YcaO-like family protein [Nocardioides convexus]|uniref:YcaO-like family protein n=1 Tax=Nocardioides convexus TaxID=2712224 RepID=UPI0024184E89|nr:YcaO-like family protein [Nocardioides convexus]